MPAKLAYHYRPGKVTFFGHLFFHVYILYNLILPYFCSIMVLIRIYSKTDLIKASAGSA